MWLRCYDCHKKGYVEQNMDNKRYYSKEVFNEGNNGEEWHLDTYRVKEEDMDMDTSEASKCDKCGSMYYKKWGHPSFKVFLCHECFSKIRWIA